MRHAASGAIETGEGVLGLRRALVLSGAESALMSLWKVDDEATRGLMTTFYGALVGQGIGRAEALRRAQLAIAGEPRWRHPAYWASFVLSGRPDALSSTGAPLGDGGLDGRASPASPPSVHPASAGGCGCRLEARARRPGAAWLAVAIAGVVRRRRGRGRGRRSAAVQRAIALRAAGRQG